MTSVSGAFVLPVDKPPGPTSHDAVDIVRRALGVRRVGHTGTLDPFASGLLLMCVGPATRLSEYLSALDKSYEAVARLGISTDTEDCEGQVVEEREGWKRLSALAIDAALSGFRGAQQQVPPQFSAKKVGGVAMHRRARRGERVELPARPITVHELELLAFEPPLLRLRVRCSSGTYVRSLARDIGRALGVGAHLTELRRTAIGRFAVADALPVASLEDPSAVREVAIDPLSALGHLPAFDVTGAGAQDLASGRPITFDGPAHEGPVVVSHGHTLVAIAEAAGGQLHPRKVFAS